MDLPIDFEHSTVYKAEQNERADAVGWITALQFDGQRGLVGSVEWTPEGREAITAAKYRYLSPVIAVRKGDRRVAALHSAALTNKPAIPGMARLAASQSIGDFLETLALAGGPISPPDGDPVNPPGGGGGDGDENASDAKRVAAVRYLLDKLRAVLGLPKDTAATEVVEALGEFVAENATAETSMSAMREVVRAEVEAEAGVRPCSKCSA